MEITIKLPVLTILGSLAKLAQKPSDNQPSNELKDEIRRLKKENKRLLMERDGRIID